MGDFAGAWQGYSPERFLNYGRLPGNLLMINWPQCGNDYGEGAGRLVESETARQEFLQESRWHSQNFAHFIQTQLGRRYGLANNIFPSGELKTQGRQGDTAPTSFALHPYYRESRRVVGLTTIREPDILPVAGGRVANLPVDAKGKISAIAIGNYANDHHYPNYDFPLQSKSIRWGGRWTGTPFTIPYGSLIPAEVDGLLVCEKNISVSHIANGATRLQPVVLGIGQAAGMAAALCIQRGCQPRDLPVRVLQEALLADPQSAAAIIPLFNLPPDSPDWLQWQRYYLDNPDVYPTDGNYPGLPESSNKSNNSKLFSGIFQRQNEQDYIFTLNDQFGSEETWKLVTLQAEVDQQLQTCLDQQFLKVWGRLNSAGNWLLVEKID